MVLTRLIVECGGRMEMERFEDLSNPKLKNIYVITDNETNEYLNSIPLLLNKLNELDKENKILTKKLNNCKVMKERFKDLSSDAFSFLTCYEKAINEVTEEYKDNQDVIIALDKLDEYYSRYEKMGQ